MAGETSIVFDPMVPPAWLAALAALLLAAALAGLLRRARGAWFRLGFAVAALGFLANPLQLQHQRQVQPDIAIMIVDETDSQAQAGRLDQTRAAADALLAQSAGDASLVWRQIRLDGDDGETALFTALADALRQEPGGRLAGAVLLSDGLAHDAVLRAALMPLDAPVHALLAGDPDMRDRRLVLEEAPRFGVVGRPLTVKLRLDDGPGASGQAQLSWTDGESAPQSRAVPVGETLTVVFTPRHAGRNTLRFSAPALDGETILFNNEALLSINAVRDRLRVLLVTGEPHAGERLWRGTLKSDPAVDLVHFTILRLPSSRDTASPLDLALIPFPTRQLFDEKLGEFNLVIFDRYTLRGVLDPGYLANLAAYVRGGGAVLASVGPEFAHPYNLAATPLGAVLPASPTGAVIERGLKPALTDIGKRHPVTAQLPEAWSGSNWGRWFRFIEAEPAQADVLMQAGGNLPLLVLDRVEGGRIALLLSDQLWLWGRGVDGGGPYGELIRRLAHWLMKEPDLEEEALRAEAQGHAIGITRHSLSSDPGPVTLTGPDGSRQDIALTPAGQGPARARANVSGPGVYEISDGRQRALVAAGGMDGVELRRLRPTAEHVGPLVGATGGGLFWLKDGVPKIRRLDPQRRMAGRDWLGLAQRAAGPVSGVRQTPLVPLWAALVAMLGLLGLGWLRESR